jgi:hypothetical protein
MRVLYFLWQLILARLGQEKFLAGLPYRFASPLGDAACGCVWPEFFMDVFAGCVAGDRLDRCDVQDYPKNAASVGNKAWRMTGGLCHDVQGQIYMLPTVLFHLGVLPTVVGSEYVGYRNQERVSWLNGIRILFCVLISTVINCPRYCGAVTCSFNNTSPVAHDVMKEFLLSGIWGRMGDVGIAAKRCRGLVREEKFV